MAAITNRLLRLRSNVDPYVRPYSGPIHHHFSSSSEPPPTTSGPEADSETRSSFSSYIKDVKSSLQKEPPQRNRPQSPRIPISFSNPTHPEPPPSKIASLEEISKHLSEFRRRSAAPRPSSSDASGQPVSLQELYKRNVTDGSDSSAATPLGPAAGGNPSFDVIRESIWQLRSSAPSQMSKNDTTGKPIDPLSLARLKESLKLKPGRMNGDPVIIGGSDTATLSFFGKDKNGRGDKDAVGAVARRTEFVLTHSYLDLGKKLEMLRPENKKGKWFSLQELNERLVKLSEMESTEMKARNLGFQVPGLRESLEILKMKKEEEEQARRNTMQRFDVLGHLGGTPSYMLSSPKEHLVERYFHPDHMSSAEKLKLELKKVRDEFKMSESDCGSTRVQVAQLTTKIKHLSTVLRKKDKHSRKGLQEMVQRRKKLLKYLRRTDWDSYCLVLSKLGLRDNPDFKA